MSLSESPGRPILDTKGDNLKHFCVSQTLKLGPHTNTGSGGPSTLFERPDRSKTATFLSRFLSAYVLALFRHNHT